MTVHGTSDVAVIGAGIAGLSLAAELAPFCHVSVVERESAAGYHSSGRSAAFSHFGIGDRVVRALTRASKSWFDAPPADASEHPLAVQTPALFIANLAMLPRLEQMEAQFRPFSDAVERLDEAAMTALCPVLRFGEDAVVAGLCDFDGRALDVAAALDACQRVLLRHGGERRLKAEVVAIERIGSDWRLSLGDGGSVTAPVVVNAAGAWADYIAALAGVAPLDLKPLRRTVIIVDALTASTPEPLATQGWPFVKTAVDHFYMAAQGGRLIVSPTDEIPSEPCDAIPDEMDMAIAADRLEHWTHVSVRRLAGKWAGLRTFRASNHPCTGFAADAPGFYWCAGQGGFGIQTAPAMARAGASLILGSPWPAELAALEVTPADLAP